MKQVPRRARLSVWGGLAAAALSATAFVSAPFSPFEPSDDPTASSWCYTWGVVNPLPKEADGLRLLVEGPQDVASFYEGPGNPFGPPVSHGPTPLGYEVRFAGAPVAPGQEVSVGFCTRSPIGKLRGPDNGPAYEWSLGGVPLPEQGSSAVPGYAWGYTGKAEGPFQPLLTLTNPEPTPLHIKQLEWAVVDAPLPPEALEWNKVEGLVDFRRVEVEPFIPPAASPEEDGLLKAVLPLETSPDDPRYVVLRAFTVSEDGVHTVRAVMQAQLAGAFVEPTRSEATTVRWDRLVFPKEKLEPGLRERLKTEGKLPLLVYLPQQADLSHAYTLTSWEERGKYVLDQLRATAESSQKELLAFVAENTRAGRVAQYESFYVINVVVVTAGADFLDALAARPDVAYIEGFAEYEQPESGPPKEGLSTQAWNNVGHIGAPAVWNQLGLTGTGVVVANIDTGVQFNHPSLVNQYRGTATGSHHFNWFDASTYNPNSPPGSGYQAVPYDPNGHGTHTMGTIVGSGGIGVAPGARWIAARTGGSSYSAMALSLLRAGQWILAPFAPAAGLGPDSSRRPHVVNNSWGCRPYKGTCAGGGDLWYQGVISNWRAAGILPVFAAGNEGSGSKTLRSPGDYAESFTVGATNSGDNIAGFSSRGPSTLTGEMKPDISAPGVDIRSAWPSNSFNSIQGTSMAAPHVAGCAALIFQASQDYRLYLEFVENFMTGTAVDRGNAGPDKHYGHGRLNCFAAVRMAVEVAPSLQYMTPGVGWEAQGADIAMGNIDTNPRPDVVMMAYDAPPGPNTFRYRIGWNLNTNGVPSGWQPGFITVSGLGWEGQGAGAALHDLDGNGRPELVLMAVDSPPGPNTFRFTIGWNLNTSGVASSWSTLSQVGAPGWEAQGGAIAITNIGGSSRPDLLVMMYDNPLGANQFRYMVGWDMSTSGVVSSWSPTQFIPGVGWEAQGAGLAVANLGRGSRPDLVLMAYDNPPGGNTFRYRIGWDVGTNGVSTDWGGWVTYIVDGLGWEAQGAGVAINDVNGNGIPEFFLMAYDNPYGPNTFRYKVIQ